MEDLATWGNNEKYAEYEVGDPNDSLNPSLRGRLASFVKLSAIKSNLRHLSSRDLLQPLGRFYITTDSRQYQYWWLFMVMTSLYSSMFTPLEFGFFRGLPRKLWVIDLCVQFIFLLDIFVKFNTAFKDRKSYRLIADHRSIAIRYIKSEFLIDLLGCLPWDTIYKVFGRKEEVRYLVWIRLYRVRKVDSFFVRLEKDIRVNYFASRIFKLLAVEFYCAHIAACIYYYLATTLNSRREGYTWIGSLTLGDFSYSNFRHIDLGKLYVTSLYWAILTMATVGYGDIHAVNPREMVFVMIYVSFDMILGAYLLGNMTALIVKGSSTEKFREKMTTLLKYMNRNELPRNIRKQMKNHIRLQFEHGTLTEEDVMSSLPVSIRTTVAHSLYMEIVSQVSIFKGCSTEFLNEIVGSVTEEYFLPGHVAIRQGGASDQFYIICEGSVEEEFIQEDGKIEVVAKLEDNTIFGEVGVLCNIPQPFSVYVTSLCRVLRLDKHSINDIMEIYLNDGRLLVNNLLESKNVDGRVDQIAADITFLIAKQAAESALMVNNASYHGDLGQLKHLVKRGAIVIRPDYDGRTPLHLAASKGFDVVVLYLIREGADTNAIDNFGNSPLLEAVKGGHDHCMAVLQEQGGKLHLEDAGGYLCKLAMSGNIELLRRLLTAGADVNASDYDKRTALHLAAAEGNATLVEILINAGANPHVRDRWGRIPLDEALLHQHAPVIPFLREAAAKRAKNEGSNHAKPSSHLSSDPSSHPTQLNQSLSKGGSGETDNTNLEEDDYCDKKRLSIDYASSTQSDSFSGSPRRGLNNIFQGGRSTSNGFGMENENSSRKYRMLAPMRRGVHRPSVSDQAGMFSGRNRKRVTIFPYHPWTPKSDQTGGKVEWIPTTIEELLSSANQYFGKKFVKVLNQDAGDFTSTDFILDGEKIYVVEE